MRRDRSAFAVACVGIALLLLLVVGFGVAPMVRKVGSDGKDGYIVATGQRVNVSAQGRGVFTYNGRPVDLAQSPDGQTIYAKDDKGITVVSIPEIAGGIYTEKIAQRLSFPKGGGSMHGIAMSRDGKRVFATNSGSELYIATVADDGQLSWTQTVALPNTTKIGGASYPCGIVLSNDEKTAYVCLSRSNSLAVVDLATGKVTREIETGVAPYDVVLSGDGKTAFVSNWGGRRARAGELSASSAGTMVPVDKRGVATTGSVSFVDLGENRETAQVIVGLHPSDLLRAKNGKTLYVANANSDTISVLDTKIRVVTQTIVANPTPRLAMSGPNALALSRDETTLFVALANLNAVGVMDVASGKLRGLMPTGFFPGALLESRSDGILVASVKGVGSRGTLNASEKGHSVYSVWGSLQRFPTNLDAATLAKLTAKAKADALEPEAVAALVTGPRANVRLRPVPVPARVGEPSVFKHCVYIIKENRTYDQVLGDLPQGDGDPRFCLYGRKITPNHHALAEQFVLLDNFYCNGVNSADGHSWATEANNTDSLEKSFGGFTRSYTFGDDPLTYSRSGFVWDNVLDNGQTFKNYGEMDYTNEKPNVSYTAILEDWQKKTNKLRFEHNIGIARLKKYSHPTYPGWNMDIPDVMRADVFLKDLAQMERPGGKFPNLTIIYLPNDHTSGTTPGDPTPNAYMADNDLALGRVVEGISKSRFWKQTCIFVVEDDPQAGVDHVDGHRSPGYVISPYTRRGVVISNFYNQTSVIHTMEQILGLLPMNRMDAMSPLMTACFTDKPDFAPYKCLPNNVPIGELNPKPKTSDARARRFAQLSQNLDLSRPDRIKDDTLNRILWHAARGGKKAYPARFAGAHGRGLKGRGLLLVPDSADD